MDVFSRYAPFIQDFIYRNDWENLRGIQVAAADAIFNTDENVLLTASTASGKTEAAFFPILTLLSETPPKSIGALYIGPLKALINDQFGRLEELCIEENINVWHWHGDVSPSHKDKMLKNPSGVLQITPESLEALLIRKHAMIPKLFCDLRFIVIDEVHSVLRGDRGAQMVCLMERLSKLAGVNPRRIGLSATLGEPEAVGEYLSKGTGRKTIIPKIKEPPAKWRLSMEHFYVSKENQEAAEEKSEEIGGLTPLGEKTDIAPTAADPGLGYIFEHSKGKKCLVFTNSREECEVVTTTLRRYCEVNGERERFLIHHGNLSQSFRETAEEIMKDEDSQFTTVTTATLELGIDIGKLERAFQIDAPFTVSSFLQRMGRTGRRSNPPEMWFVMREEEPSMRSLLPDTIPWKLLQGIALVQVYREEKWVEPPRLERMPFSLLYHQTMSTLASSGEMSAKELAQRVLKLTPFASVSIDDYKLMLKHLIETDHIQKTDEGGLIVGLTGERVTNSYKFYAVFQENVEYSVKCESQELGTVVMPPPVGEKLAIAGRVWTVEEIDHKRHVVFVELVKGTVPAYFGDCPGDINTKILKRMRKVLDEDIGYPFLMKNANLRLLQARTVSANAKFTKKPLVNLGGNMYCLLPWLGTYSFLAMERFLKIKCGAKLGIKGLTSERPYYIQFKMSATEDEFYEVVKNEASHDIDPMELVYDGEVPLFEKYDEYVPPELIRKGFAKGVLNVKEMLETVRSWNF